MKNCIILYFFILFNNVTFSQNYFDIEKKNTDCISDSCIVESYLNKAKLYLNKNNDSVIYYKNKARSHSKNYLIGQASIKNIEAIIEFGKGNYEHSRALYYEAIKIAYSKKDSLKIGAYLNNIGLTYTYQGNYESSILNLMESLKIREQIKDSKISSTYNNLGVAYERLGNLKMAKKFQFLALKEKNKQKQMNAISNTLNNLGIIYRKMEIYDSSVYFYKKALITAKVSKNLSQVSNTYNNLGYVYFLQENAAKAEEYYIEAITLKKKLGKSYELRNSYSNLCKLYLKKGNAIKAKKYFDLAEEQKDSLDSKSTDLSQLQLKVQLETALGNYKTALKNSNDVFTLYKELVNEKNIKIIEELNTKYETAKKQKEITLTKAKNELQQKEIEQNKIITTSFIIGAILLLLIILIIFSLYKLKQKTNNILTKKNNELIELNAVKDQLFSIISHDLKNPVFAFKNLTTNLSKGIDILPAETLQNILSQLENTSNTLYNSLNNLLSWSLTQQNKILIHTTTINIHELMSEIISLHNVNIDEKKIKITNALETNIIIKSDYNILSTVFRNVLMNAIKFSPKNSNITISNSKTHIKITDHGIGISKNDIAKLFDIRNDIKSIGDSPEKGTGLGLILCKELLERINGEIEIKSEIDKGTTVSIILPQSLK